MKYRLRRLRCWLTRHVWDYYSDDDSNWFICRRCDDYYQEETP